MPKNFFIQQGTGTSCAQRAKTLPAMHANNRPTAAERRYRRNRTGKSRHLAYPMGSKF